ncbi:MAG TPA: hypothetical protein VMB26_03260, partial [Candidatus Binataceae bacterium]|nr:hypothetical protein [Candidatus Binataceae bacterium]
IGRDCQRDEILGEIIGETLCANGSETALLSSKRLVMPADLLRSSSARLRIRAACVDQSFETYELASLRLSRLELTPAHAHLAGDLVKTLFLASFSAEPGRRRLKPSDLAQLVPSHQPAVDAALISELLASMASELDGVIALEGGGAARYRHSDPPDSFLRRWNDGLALLRLVEPELTKVYDMVTLFAQAEKFRATLCDRRADLSGQAGHLRYLAAILGASPRALIALNAFGNLLATGNHEAYLKQAAISAGGAANLPALTDEIARLERLANRAPKLIEIKRYLDAIPGNREALRQIEPIRLQLLVELDFQSLLARHELADSIIERFENFKLEYRELYRAAHRAHHAAVDQFARKLELQEIRFPVLTRLNRVRELGQPLGIELEHELKMLAHELTSCSDSCAPDLADASRCRVCEYRFESGPPLAELDQFEERLGEALKEKWKALSSTGLIRILTQADSQGRLNEMLELLRQEAFDRLAATVDEDTAVYIVGLLIKARS